VLVGTGHYHAYAAGVSDDRSAAQRCPSSLRGATHLRGNAWLPSCRCRTAATAQRILSCGRRASVGATRIFSARRRRPSGLLHLRFCGRRTAGGDIREPSTLLQLWDFSGRRTTCHGIRIPFGRRAWRIPAARIRQRTYSRRTSSSGIRIPFGRRRITARRIRQRSDSWRAGSHGIRIRSIGRRSPPNRLHVRSCGWRAEANIRVSSAGRRSYAAAGCLCLPYSWWRTTGRRNGHCSGTARTGGRIREPYARQAALLPRA
jgi:hypothetical protein